MRKKRIYHAPFVLTVAALAVPACTNDEPEDISCGVPDGLGGADGNTGGTLIGTGGVGTGGVGTGGTAVGTGGTVNGLPACEFTEEPLPCEVGARCQLATDCTNAAKETFVFECREDLDVGRWALAPSDPSCDKPFLQCYRLGAADMGTFTCLDSIWEYSGAGGNPPAPCPRTLPEEGSECRPGNHTGLDPAACGYPCADGSGWTVTGCAGTGETGTWQSDGCGLGGAGGFAGGTGE